MCSCRFEPRASVDIKHESEVEGVGFGTDPGTVFGALWADFEWEFFRDLTEMDPGEILSTLRFNVICQMLFPCTVVARSAYWNYYEVPEILQPGVSA